MHMPETDLSRTALFDEHLSSGAKMVDFHGFELPIWYSSIQEEHIATRSGCGLFDVSHMGFFRFSGDGVKDWLTSISTQNFMNFHPGRCGYTHFLDEEGYIIDDMIFAISDENEVFGVPNSSMVGIMLDWLNSKILSNGSISIEDLSEKTSILALQGPESISIVGRLLGVTNMVRRFHCQKIEENELGVSGWIQGTGYTGESGVEIFCNDVDAVKIWRELISTESYGVVPIGLGARDTLRMEKGYLLSGQDFLWPRIGGESGNEKLPEGFLSRNTIETAVPYGLESSHDFIGKKSTESHRSSEIRWRGLICTERGPSPRVGHQVFDDPEGISLIGYVTSGGPSPSLGMNGIALAYLNGKNIGDNVWIKASKRKMVKAEVAKTPFI